MHETAKRRKGAFSILCPAVSRWIFRNIEFQNQTIPDGKRKRNSIILLYRMSIDFERRKET
jgi:hypothetical protein